MLHMCVESLGNSPVCVAMGESVGLVRAWSAVREEERSCILVLLLPSEGEAAGLWLPLNGDWRDKQEEEEGKRKEYYFRI